MSRPTLDQFQTIFIHVPKTGGVAVDRYFRIHHAVPDFTGHHAARNVRSKFPEKFAQYFKFAFVRNPWERLVSAFFFLEQGGYSKIDRTIREQYVAPYQGDFPAFVQDLPNHPEMYDPLAAGAELTIDGLPFLTTHFLPQSYWLCDEQGSVLVDFVGRFEQLQKDFETVLETLVLPKHPLEHANKSRHDEYRSHYTDALAELVGKLYAHDIRRFSYTF